MTMLLRQLAGLLVDDGALALAIIAIVGLAGMVALLLPDVPLAAGSVLVFGCLGALLLSVAILDRRGFDRDLRNPCK